MIIRSISANAENLQTQLGLGSMTSVLVNVPTKKLLFVFLIFTLHWRFF